MNVRRVWLLPLSLCWMTFTQAGEVRTIAGNGQDGTSKPGTLATQTPVGGPFGVVIGPDDRLYIGETTGHVVSRLDLDSGNIARVTGTGRPGYAGDGEQARSALVNEPYEIRFDAAGNLFFVDMTAHVVRRIDAQSGIITTVAGTGERGYSGDGGPATQAQLNRPHSIDLDESGNLYICDIGNHRLRVVDLAEGKIRTLSGTGKRSATPDGSPLSGTPLNGPRAVAFHPQHGLYLALREGNAVYRIDLDAGTLHHIAGTGRSGYSGDGGPARNAELSGPKGIAIADNGDIYLADTESHTIRVIRHDSGIIETLVGDGQQGDGPDGDPRRCRLNRPHGVFVHSDGRVFIGDSSNHKVRVYEP